MTALPLTTASAATAPSGSASASALMVKLSLQPLKAAVNSTGVLSWAQVESALNQVQTALCGTAAGCHPLGLTLPTSLPDSLTVRVAEAEDAATLNDAAGDIVAGHSDSTPIATDWSVLNANLSALQSLITNLVNSGLADLASGNVNALQGLLTTNAGSLTANIPVLGTASFNLLGTVAASLPGKAVDSATAVQVTGNQQAGQLTHGLNVTVDPFHAAAVNNAAAPKYQLNSGQVSADNSLVAVSLPALSITGSNAVDLKGLAGELKTLVNAITNALANPSQAGNILTAAPVPSALQGPLSTIAGLINSTAGGAVSGVSSATGIDLSALQLFDTKLSAALDSLNALINALANLQLPDVSNLITSTADIATAKTVPVTGGGVASTATATLGAVNVLPIGSTLQGLVNTALAPLGLKAVTSSTPLLSVQGITASAQASVGPGGSQAGSAGLRTVSVLGQSIDLDKLTSGAGLAPGQEWNHVFTLPGLGSLTLDITRGVPQVVADTANYREVHMAALDVRLINGAAACTSSQCTDPLSLNGTTTNVAAAPHVAGNGSTGIAALGPDGDIVEVAAPQAIAAAAMSPIGSETINKQTQGSQTTLPPTGVFGEGGLAAGLGLIGVAISLRLLPNLRQRVRRVR